ncbi:hypothetical protein D3C87_1845600 [compost metagenome]
MVDWQTKRCRLEQLNPLSQGQDVGCFLQGGRHNFIWQSSAGQDQHGKVEQTGGGTGYFHVWGNSANQQPYAEHGQHHHQVGPNEVNP